MKRRDPRTIKPSQTDGDLLQTIDGKTAWGPLDVASAGVPSVLLEVGQTVAQYETANGVTLSVPTIILRKA